MFRHTLNEFACGDVCRKSAVNPTRHDKTESGSFAKSSQEVGDKPRFGEPRNLVFGPCIARRGSFAKSYNVDGQIIQINFCVSTLTIIIL